MTHRYGLSRVELELLSVELEAETGYDSIFTIWGSYLTDDTGRYQCVDPRCPVTTTGPTDMWEHVHFSKRHGLSFGASLAELIEHRRTGRPLP